MVVALVLPLAAGVFARATGAQAMGASGCDSVAGNPVQNCGFEHGLTDWTSTGHNGYGPSWQHTGAYGAYMATVGSTGSLSQTVGGLKPNFAYYLGFYLQNLSTGANSFAVQVSNVVGGPLTFNAMTNAPATFFTQYTDVFTTLPDGTAPTVTFIARADSGSWALDDVEVSHGPSECDSVGHGGVPNCGFDIGRLDGWTSTGTNGVGPDWAHSGNDGAYLATSGETGSLSQTFGVGGGGVTALNISAPYVLSYWVENPMAGTPNSFALVVSNVVGGPLTFNAMTNADTFGWTQYTDSFMTLGDGTQPTISFVARNDSAAFGLDDVEIASGPSLCDGVAGNLVQNCGFEDRNAHWTPTGDAGAGAGFYIPQLLQIHSGNDGGGLTNQLPEDTADSMLSQAITGTSPSTTYDFSYWRGHNDIYSDNFFQVLVSNVVGGPLTFDLTGDLPRSGWVRFTHTFTTLPDGTPPTITFDGFNRYGAWLIDDVEVTPEVVQATPVIDWPAPTAISYGTALSSAQLNATAHPPGSTASVAGTFAYTPPAGTVLGAGTHTLGVHFAPTDTADYADADAQVTLQVDKGTPTITWADPAPITSGTPVSSTQLDASADVPGTFSYTPDAGTVLTPGRHKLSVTFTPDDTADYTTTSASVHLIVDQPPAITSADGASFTVGTAGSFTITSTGDSAKTPVHISASGLPAWLTVSDQGDGTATLAGTPPAGSVGSDTFTVTADNGVPPAATQPFTLTVARAATTTMASADTGIPGFGQPVTFTARVSAPSGQTLAPTGTVSFFLNGATSAITTVPLRDDGTAVFTTSGLAAGANTVTATYSGDADFEGSTAPTGASVTVGGPSCTVDSDYSGTLVVDAGQTVTVCGAHLTGSVIVQPGGALDIENSTTTGQVSLSAGGPVRICGSSIGGTVTVTGSRSWVVIGDPADGCAANTIGGSLIVQHNHHGVQVLDNTVAGSVIATDNSGSGPFPVDTVSRVAGNGH